MWSDEVNFTMLITISPLFVQVRLSRLVLICKRCGSYRIRSDESAFNRRICFPSYSSNGPLKTVIKLIGRNGAVFNYPYENNNKKETIVSWNKEVSLFKFILSIFSSVALFNALPLFYIFNKPHNSINYVIVMRYLIYP